MDRLGIVQIMCDSYLLYREGNSAGTIAAAYGYGRLFDRCPRIWPPVRVGCVEVFTSVSDDSNVRRVIFHCDGGVLRSVNVCCPSCRVVDELTVMDIVDSFLHNA